MKNRIFEKKNNGQYFGHCDNFLISNTLIIFRYLSTGITYKVRITIYTSFHEVLFLKRTTAFNMFKDAALTDGLLTVKNIVKMIFIFNFRAIEI
jgi:hypothetical protein